MKRLRLTTACLVLAALLFVSFMSSANAGVYAATERDDRGDAWPEMRIWLLINTDTGKLEFKWDSPAIILLPIGSEFIEIVWLVWDDKGFSWGGYSMREAETITLDYTHHYTWAYAEAWWMYRMLGTGAPLFFHAKIYLYVSGSNGGGSGGGRWLHPY